MYAYESCELWISPTPTPLDRRDQNNAIFDNAICTRLLQPICHREVSNPLLEKKLALFHRVSERFLSIPSFSWSQFFIAIKQSISSNTIHYLESTVETCKERDVKSRLLIINQCSMWKGLNNELDFDKLYLIEPIWTKLYSQHASTNMTLVFLRDGLSQMFWIWISCSYVSMSVINTKVLRRFLPEIETGQFEMMILFRLESFH